MGDPPAAVEFYAPLAKAAKARSGAPMDVPVSAATQRFAEGFVERSVDAAAGASRVQTVYKDRVEGRMLLLTNPFKDNPSGRRRVGEPAAARVAGRKKITAKERRQLKIYDIPEEARRYELFQPLHRLWSKYVESLLGQDVGALLADPKQRQQLLGKLIKADLHGARMSVVRSKCPNFVGCGGIVAQETKNTFKLITEDDRLVVTPKTGCVFGLELPSGHECLLYGDQFKYRASERASKKFKPRQTVDL
ncbi:RNase P/RNase MRP complex subunit [Coemansia nantahalensis]|uniref:RNase P/RNase MRP complex subunit n=2 Tax=Coemansia TaxID=4863 RepID=A0ACC1LEB5_9FUNG|nr:RNase P/RNase MRP complex subunit [Coemansia nantahalensis]KAJ2766521.1 RNase P/RNase MRP complex subunit [Coemansia nantahalensis]KAJ2806023.1 RNase P/RNase MRP complex subunit [Coemansia helicoidea]